MVAILVLIKLCPAMVAIFISIKLYSAMVVTLILVKICAAMVTILAFCFNYVQLWWPFWFFHGHKTS
jgi:hypothetical protein